MAGRRRAFGWNLAGIVGRRGRRWRRLAACALPVMALVAVEVPTMAPAAAALPCTQSQLVPVVRGAEANQGLPGYNTSMSKTANPLTWGKDTLVKVYLSLPDPSTCDSTGQSITLVQNSALDVTVGTTTTSLTTPMGGTSNTNSATTADPNNIVATSQAPAANSTGDPIWAVGGSLLAPAGATAPFSVTFTARVNYSAKLSATSTAVNGTTPSYSFSVQFDKQANALRVLVVPMGDASGLTGTPQFSASASAAVQTGMQVLSRALPVASGIASLTDTSTTPAPGLRYTIDSGLLDLGVKGLNLMNPVTPKFCGGGSSMAGISKALDSYLKSWNDAQSTSATKANRVLGVIDENVSLGLANGCTEGYANVGGAEAWTRVYYKSTSPKWTGPLTSMELGHTLGLSPIAPAGTSGTTPDDCTHFTGDAGDHSYYSNADGCGYADTTVSPPAFKTGRAFNVVTASYLPRTAQAGSIFANRSVTHLNSDGFWVDDNVLFENQDYQAAECVLGASSTNCPTTTVSGGFAAAGAGARFMISGQITLGSPSTADVADSYVTTTGYDTSAVSSRWSLAYLNGTGLPTAPQDGVLVNFSASEHYGAPGPQIGNFISSRLVPAGTQTIELLDTGVIPAAVLYTAKLDQVPVVSGSSSTSGTGVVTASAPAHVTDTPTVNEGHPALSGTGLAAWTTANGLVVAPVANPANAAPVPGTDGTATNPGFTRDGKKLVYEDGNGNIWTDDVAWNGASTGPASFSNPTQIYNSILNTGLAPAHHPSFSPPVSVNGVVVASADRVVVEYSGNLFVIYLQQGTGPLGCTLPGQVLSGSCSQITGSGGPTAVGTDAHPSWAPTGNLIAFDRNGSVDSVDAGRGESSVTALVTNAHQPSWANGLIAFQRSGNIWLADPSNAAATAQQVTFLATGTQLVDQSPALSGSPAGGQLLFQRQFQNPTQTDIMRVDLTANTVVTNATTYTITATDDSAPGSLRAEFFRTCPDGHRDVLAAAVAPGDVDGSKASFQTTLNPDSIPTLGCTGGTVTAQVTDGWSLSPPATVGSISGASSPRVTTQTEPQPGTTFQQGHLVGLAASSYDADAGPLPSSAFTFTITGPSGTTTYPGSSHIYVAPGTGGYSIGIATNYGGRQDSAGSSMNVVTDKPPVATITSPPSGATFAPGSSVTVQGSATDPEDGTLPAGALDWTVSAPDGTTQQFHNTGSFTLTAQASGTWALKLTATDSDGSIGTTSSTFRVSYNASVNFSPSTINAPPLPSDPQWVNVVVRLSSQDLSAVDPSTVRIVKIGSYTAASDPSFPNLRGGCAVSTGQCSTSAGWTVNGTVGNQVATVQFDRIALANYLAVKGLLNQYVPIYVAGTAPTYSFQGADPASPYVQAG